MCINRKGHLSAGEKYCMCKLHIAVFVLQNFRHSVNVWDFFFLVFALSRSCPTPAEYSINVWWRMSLTALGHCLADRANIVSQEAHRGKWNKDTQLSPRRIRGWMGAELLLCLGKIFPCCCRAAKINLRPRVQCKRKKFHVKIKCRIKSHVLNVSRWCKIRWDFLILVQIKKLSHVFIF